MPSSWIRGFLALLASVIIIAVSVRAIFLVVEQISSAETEIRLAICPAGETAPVATCLLAGLAVMLTILLVILERKTGREQAQPPKAQDAMPAERKGDTQVSSLFFGGRIPGGNPLWGEAWALGSH